MNQKKIGSFLKELRKEKGMTQEQLGEVLAYREEPYPDEKPVLICRTYLS